MSYNIVLCNPEIPQNTGNIVRTCAVTGSRLHLIRPLGFSADDRRLKRAGLDYWHLTPVFYYDGFEELLSQVEDGENVYFMTPKALKTYHQVSYREGDYLVFGGETNGLDAGLLEGHAQQCVRLPRRGDAHFLNISNAVAVVLYEALRQNEFRGLI